MGERGKDDLRGIALKGFLFDDRRRKSGAEGLKKRLRLILPREIIDLKKRITKRGGYRDAEDLTAGWLTEELRLRLRRRRRFRFLLCIKKTVERSLLLRRESGSPSPRDADQVPWGQGRNRLKGGPAKEEKRGMALRGKEKAGKGKSATPTGHPTSKGGRRVPQKEKEFFKLQKGGTARRKNDPKEETLMTVDSKKRRRLISAELSKRGVLGINV